MYMTAWSLQPKDFIETEKVSTKAVRDVSRTQSDSPVIAAQRFTETENVPTQRVMKIGQPK